MERSHDFPDRNVMDGARMTISFSQLGTELYQILGGNTFLADAPRICVRYQIYGASF